MEIDGYQIEIHPMIFRPVLRNILFCNFLILKFSIIAKYYLYFFWWNVKCYIKHSNFFFFNIFSNISMKTFDIGNLIIETTSFTSNTNLFLSIHFTFS